MPEKKPRQDQRKEVWLTEKDMEHVSHLAEEMNNLGFDPTNSKGEINLSKVVRYALRKSTPIRKLTT